VVDVGRREDRMLDHIAKRQKRDREVLRTIELWRITEPGMSLALDEIAAEIRQPLPDV
jgi:hypothetical protein